MDTEETFQIYKKIVWTTLCHSKLDLMYHFLGNYKFAKLIQKNKYYKYNNTIIQKVYQISITKIVSSLALSKMFRKCVTIVMFKLFEIIKKNSIWDKFGKIL